MVLLINRSQRCSSQIPLTDAAFEEFHWSGSGPANQITSAPGFTFDKPSVADFFEVLYEVVDSDLCSDPEIFVMLKHAATCTVCECIYLKYGMTTFEKKKIHFDDVHIRNILVLTPTQPSPFHRGNQMTPHPLHPKAFTLREWTNRLLNRREDIDPVKRDLSLIETGRKCDGIDLPLLNEALEEHSMQMQQTIRESCNTRGIELDNLSEIEFDVGTSVPLKGMNVDEATMFAKIFLTSSIYGQGAMALEMIVSEKERLAAIATELDVRYMNLDHINQELKKHLDETEVLRGMVLEKIQETDQLESENATLSSTLNNIKVTQPAITRLFNSLHKVPLGDTSKSLR